MMSLEQQEKGNSTYFIPYNFLLENFQNLRIIQPSLVFLHGIPEILSTPNILQEEVQNYGKVTKISIKKISKDFYSAFVNFEEPTHAALAILGLNGFEISNRKIRASYGSTKFCPFFLRNQECSVNDCNYAHFYIPQLSFFKECLQDFNHRLYAFNQVKNSKLKCLQNQLKLKSNKEENKKKALPSGLQVIATLETKEKKDEWNEIYTEIDTFIEDLTGQEKQKPRSRIQQFLDEAEKTLMELIFRSSQN